MTVTPSPYAPAPPTGNEVDVLVVRYARVRVTPAADGDWGAAAIEAFDQHRDYTAVTMSLVVSPDVAEETLRPSDVEITVHSDGAPATWLFLPEP